MYIWVTNTQEKKCSQYQDWGDDSVDKNTCCSSPQHPVETKHSHACLEHQHLV